MQKIMNRHPKKTSKKLCLASIMGAATLFASVSSQAVNQVENTEDATTLPVNLSSGTFVTEHEVAVLHVLSEVCPPLLNAQQKNNFYTTYNVKLQEMFPTIENPKMALQYLSTQQKYKDVLVEMRNKTMSYPKAENLALCTDLANEAVSTISAK